MERSPYLPAIKKALADLYGDRLQGVILFGSEARGDASPDSDIDLLVLLVGPVEWGREIRRIIEALYPIQLEVFRPIHAWPVDCRKYETADFGFYASAREEGVAL
jgi:predicted nucleotidyltransferase